ncbi:carbohydrate binding family 9 domain-containing protein [Thalassotalea crassostreae]|uniref:carbohydrate binding family 9 domain-containing protein n=1 Tax=Thalassotalea crassostreae TaxID=1763536 RepID=UPI0008399218|nr:carbohydrate binding family 9 domain-containing protein [Thalassotalea crassostreae]
MGLLRKSAKQLFKSILFCGLYFPFIATAAINIPHINSQIKIDGDLSDPVWQQAQHFDVNIVNVPYENTPSPVKTDAYIYEDGEYLYVAFNAQDPDVDKLQSFLKDRDTTFSDDIVGIKLDTFNDHRLAYQFFVNPSGVQNDSIGNEMTRQDNNAWDALWQSSAIITDKGYQVEFAIPFSQLNYEKSQDIKTWSIEFIRIYPRDNLLRISNIPIDRDNSCWTCQMLEIQGFQNAKAKENILITPSVVASNQQTRDVYNNNDDDWDSENDVDLGVSLRWGITPDILLNATINPDFSTVEADAGVLTVNTTDAIFFDEKRPFFLDNAEYFSTPFNLIYTRNIADPDYGSKLTGKVDKHSFGFFMTKDSETNIIAPDSLYSRRFNLDDESYSGALRYRYDVNNDLSFGFVSTLRSADDYQNLVTGLDSKYKFSASNSIVVQVLSSESEYPELTGVTDTQDISDTALNIEIEHDSENWFMDVEYQDIGRDFRADLGYMPRVDYNEISSTIKRKFYSENSLWTKADLGVHVAQRENDAGEQISKKMIIKSGIEGPWQSNTNLNFISQEKVGLRYDDNDNAIDGNTTSFELNSVEFYTQAKPLKNIYFNLYALVGDNIDYANDRLGDSVQISPRLIWNMNRHLELNFNYSFAQLDVDNDYVYRQKISDLRLTYAFNVNSFIRFTAVYYQTERNAENNPELILFSEENNSLGGEILYSYKLNPQTVFFLGYSENAIENDLLNELKSDERTAFLKLSYAFH